MKINAILVMQNHVIQNMMNSANMYIQNMDMDTEIITKSPKNNVIKFPMRFVRRFQNKNVKRYQNNSVIRYQKKSVIKFLRNAAKNILRSQQLATNVRVTKKTFP